MLKPLAAALLVAFMASPAAASTVPRVDFGRADTFVAIGVLDANLDHALTDRLSVGASASLPWAWVIGAGRVTYRALEAYGASFGVTGSVGVITPGLVNLPPGMFPTTAPWAQLALNAAVPIGPWPVTLRGTYGPTFTNAPLLPTVEWVPNVELAWRVHPAHELTLGGASLVGWRGTFGRP